MRNKRDLPLGDPALRFLPTWKNVGRNKNADPVRQQDRRLC